MLSFLSSVSLVTSDSIAQFAVLYSVGQVLNIVGSMILVTPKGQWKAMTSKTRRITSIVYILSIIVTLVVACTVHIKALTYIFLGIQICAYYWYMLSFVPCARDAAIKLCKKACC